MLILDSSSDFPDPFIYLFINCIFETVWLFVSSHRSNTAFWARLKTPCFSVSLQQQGHILTVLWLDQSAGVSTTSLNCWWLAPFSSATQRADRREKGTTWWVCRWTTGENEDQTSSSSQTARPDGKWSLMSLFWVWNTWTDSKQSTSSLTGLHLTDPNQFWPPWWTWQHRPGCRTRALRRTEIQTGGVKWRWDRRSVTCEVWRLFSLWQKQLHSSFCLSRSVSCSAGTGCTAGSGGLQSSLFSAAIDQKIQPAQTVK